MKNSRAKRVSRKLAELRNGVEPTVTAADLLACVPGEVPLPDERAVLILARTFQYVEDPDHSCTSWANQERAMEFFNKHGLSGTLDEIVRLGGSLE